MFHGQTDAEWGIEPSWRICDRVAEFSAGLLGVSGRIEKVAFQIVDGEEVVDS